MYRTSFKWFECILKSLGVWLPLESDSKILILEKQEIIAILSLSLLNLKNLHTVQRKSHMSAVWHVGSVECTSNLTVQI